MVFSSSVFLFLFLPVVLVLYAFLPFLALRNIFLLTASLFFYAWGEQSFVLVLVASIAVNYLFGLAIGRSEDRGPRTRWFAAAAIAANLGLLAFYKYGNFAVDNLNALFAPLGFDPLHLDPLHLPIGISFFTFQAMTYVIDIYRKEAQVQRNPLNVGLYLSMFPQLIAGPIVRYRAVAAQITSRTVTLDKFSSGAERFIIGLGKKMILANTVGAAADRIFSLPGESLTTGVAWVGTVCYTFQIYFDFSGYSDMAIGLGLIFGFRFPENFRYPYVSRSIREFWRRWHITLSAWFRDYLYIPLGGSRRAPARVYVNLFTVFFLCGLWHGAAWTFVIWGMIHGLFIVLERLGLERLLGKLPRAAQHAYLMFVVMTAWVFFRAETASHALVYLKAMAGFSLGDGIEYHPGTFLNLELSLALLAAAAASMPTGRWLGSLLGTRPAEPGESLPQPTREGLLLVKTGCLGVILAACAMLLASGTHNPFIYFRF
jgi:alginate O-acetyltransferase complex protein AlgI